MSASGSQVDCKVSGKFYDGLTSTNRDVEIEITGQQVSVLFEGSVLISARWRDIKVSPRVADTPRILSFENGSSCEVFDNDQIDQVARAHPNDGFSLYDLIHRLENSWRMVFISCLGLMLFYFALVKVLIPASSKAIAELLPKKVLVYLSNETLKQIDALGIIKSTNTDEETQKELLSYIQDNLPAATPNHEILFRSGPGIGANAFALPDGRIIILDELLTLMKDRREVLGVVMHELGHVKHRHGAQMLVQSSALGMLVFLAFGDATGTAIPLALIQSSYSREHEAEADLYGCKKLREMGMSTSYLSEALRKLGGQEKGGAGIPEMFLSHPATLDRIRAIDNCM